MHAGTVRAPCLRKRDAVIENEKIPLAVVLFVDGDHGEYVEALRVAGYRVEVSPSALEALARGHSLRPDALIVPLALPDMGGADLASRIGSAPTRVHTLAVVILTADGAPHRGDGPIMAGAIFCSLPCPATDLVALVGKQLATRRIMGRPQAPPS
jgi:CheY-like chemotaxis protein